ncbi:glycosyltransferase [Candidatus Saccharibacteria bacterium]|nr:glycosyltransferase [Candidatus Saccharibacteria bacterium]
MKSSLVSVIIPVFNTGASALPLAQKLLSDNYENLEILLIDDGSTDNSLKLLSSLKSPKVKLLPKPNGGVSSARNLGLDNAGGEFILFVDSDDDVSPDFISKLVKAVSKDDVSLAMTGVRYKKLSQKTDEDVYLNAFPKKPGESLETYVLRSLLHDGRLYPVFNKIFRANVIKQHSLRFNEHLKFAEDTKFVLDYLKLSKSDPAFVLEPLYIYNYGTPTSSVKKLEGDWKNWEKSFKHLQNFVGDHPTLREKALLLLVRLRWRVSWFRSKEGCR